MRIGANMTPPTPMKVALLVLALTRQVHAQQAPTPEEVHQAQARWAEGKAAFDLGNYEAARVAFKQAYTIFQHPAFLQNLGEAELRTGRMVEAAHHLTLFLRASNTGSPVQREFAKKSLTRAAEKLGSIVVETNVDEADVRIDGELVGVAPLAALAWHVMPGVHVVSGHKEGYLDGTERIQVAAGPPTRVLVRLQRVVGLPSPSARENGGESAVRSPIAPQAPPDASPSRPVEARTVVLISGAVATVVAAGIGVGFTMRANDDAAAREIALGKVSAGSFNPGEACVPPVPTERANDCATLNAKADSLRLDRFMQFVGFIGAGVLGAATIATVFVWQPSSSVGVFTPVAAPGYAGLRWNTTFD